MRIGPAFLIAFFPAALFGGYAGKELWLPVVGRTTGVGGREFFTTVTVTNATERQADVKLSWFAAQKPGQRPHSVSLHLAPRQTRRHEIDVGVGSLRVRSRVPVIATARLYSRGGPTAVSEAATVMNAIPARLAIGSGESTILHSSGAGERYRLYVAETRGFPLYFSVTLDDVKGRRTSRRLYVGPHEQRSWDFTTETFVAMHIAGVNGSGKIIVAGRDSSMHEMLLPRRHRHRMPWPEWLAYGLASAALLVAALTQWKR